MRLVLALIAFMMCTPPAAAETYHKAYGPAIGVGTDLHGASVNLHPVRAAPAAAATRVQVRVIDQEHDHVYFSLCRDLDRNGRCNADEGDVDIRGFDKLTWTPPGGIPAGTVLEVYVYTLYANETEMARGSSGYVAFTFW